MRRLKIKWDVSSNDYSSIDHSNCRCAICVEGRTRDNIKAGDYLYLDIDGYYNKTNIASGAIGYAKTDSSKGLVTIYFI